MINVAEMVNERPLGMVQIRIIILCMISALFDGFDIQTTALAMPRISAEWHLSHSASGIILSASLAGILVGSSLFGTLGDKLGRRPLILSCIFVLGILSGLTAATHTAMQLILVRIGTGIAIGACLPNVTALAAESVPSKWIGRYVILTYSSVPLGGITAAYLAPILMAGGGWRSLFLVGGLLPLLFCAVLAVWLPESVQHEARAGKNPEKTRTLLRNMFPTLQLQEGESFTVSSMGKRTGVAGLFKDGNAVLTITIWAMFFLSLLCLYTLTFWLPTFFTERHWPPAAALRTSAMFQFGGIVGGQLAGLLSERIGKRTVLLGTFFFAGILVTALGRVGGSMAVMTMLLVAAGFMVIGSQQCLTGYTAAAYHTGIRATGIGWGLGIGRFGAVLGPSFIGFGLSAGFTQANLFAVTAIPAFICCLLIPALWLGEMASAGARKGASDAGWKNA